MPDNSAKLAQLLDRLEESLAATIPGSVRALRVKDRAYAVFVVFHDTSVYDDFRPHLVVAPERLRRELFEEDPGAADIVWNPNLLDGVPRCVVDGPGLKEACAEVYRLLVSDRRENIEELELLSPVRSTMSRLAAKLNLLNWSQVLDITDDFVVVAIDDNGWDPQADMRACLAPERIALLDSRGLFENRTAMCPECGSALRTPQARQCFQCGANWH